LARGFGDCKDQALLLTALLRAGGVPARLALVNTDGPVDASLPGLGTFDHMIVFVPGTPGLWIDPTAENTPVGELPLGDQGRPALILAATSDAVVTTPRAPASANRTSETRELFLADEGNARVVETTEWRGAYAARLRDDYQHAEDKALRERLGEYVKREYDARELERYEIGHLRDANQPLTLRIEAKQADRGYTGLREATVWLRPGDIVDELPSVFTENKDDDKPRREDYVLPLPFVVERHYRVVRPEGFAAPSLPSDETVALGPARLRKQFSVDGAGVVHATFTLEAAKQRISPAEFEALRTAARQQRNQEAIKLVFDQIAEAHLKAGRVREALRECEALVARHPQQALPHTHLARALLYAGLGRAARQESARAAQLDSRPLDVVFTQAYILSHDLFGRPYGEGADLAGAEKLYRQLATRDPNNVTVRQNLAVLLEYDERGRRYVDHARLARAIDEYRAVHDELKDHSLDENLMLALVYAQRFAEVEKLAPSVPAASLAGAPLLTAIAIDRGAPAALARAVELAPEASERAKFLVATKNMLVRFRRYPEAAALMDQAARGVADGAEYRAQVDHLRRLRRVSLSSGPVRDLHDLCRRVLTAVFAEDTAALRALTIDNEQRLILPAAFDEVHELKRQLHASDISDEILRDMIELYDMRKEGDDALGYRLFIKEPFKGTESSQFAVRAAKEYRLTDMAYEPFRRVEGNDWRGARHWLDVARDSIPPKVAAITGFSRLWSDSTDDPARQRLAAAALALSARGIERAIPIVAACKVDGARDACDRALAFGYALLGRNSDALAVLTRMRTHGELPRDLVEGEIDLMLRLNQTSEASARLEAWLKLAPDDAVALRYRAKVHTMRGQVAEANADLARIVASGNAQASDLNQLAWNADCLGKLGDADVELARKAVAQSQRASWPILHTLATVLADAGHAEEARDHLIEELALHGQATDAEWYTLGRIAESYGLRDAAADAYRSVSTPKPDTPPTAVSALAQRALARLEAGARRTPK
jgi:hypothetical protein